MNDRSASVDPRLPPLQSEEEVRQALLDCQERLEPLFEKNPLPVWIFDLQTLRFLAVNETAVEHYGYSREEFLSMTLRDIRPPDEQGSLLKAIEERSTRKNRAHSRHLTRDGRILEVEIATRDIPFRGRQACLVMAFDVTDTVLSARRQEESDARWKTLVEADPDGVLIMDDQSTILSANPAAARIFGYAIEELEGHPLEMLIPERFREAHRRGVSRYLSTGRKNIPWSGVELPGLTKDGREIPVEIAFSDYVQGGRHVFAGFVRDIQDRKREEARRGAEHEVTRILAASRTLVEAGPRILHAVGTHLGWDFGAFWQRRPEQEHLFCQTTWPQEDSLADFAQGSRNLVLRAGEGLPGRAWSSGKTSWIEDVRKDANFPRAPIAKRVSLQGAVAFPLLWAGHTVGVLEFFSRKPLQVDEAMLRTLEVIGNDIGQFIQREEAEAERDRALSEAVTARQLAEDQARQLEEAQRERELANEELQRTNVALAVRTEEAERIRQAAEEANRAKSTFLANMSHELRTPINAMVGYTDLLDLGVAGPMNEAQRSYLERIRVSSHHLLGLVNEVLDLERVESGQMKVEREQIPLTPTIREAMDLIAPQAAGRGLEVRLESECGPDTLYWGDADRARQILVNLLSNAVKFTPSGGRIFLRCRLLPSGAATSVPLEGPGPWLQLEVEDTGIGIPAERLQEIFDPFIQVESGYTRESGGTGLGLTISRRLARLLGGELTVHSEVGKGSRFTLWLSAVSQEGAERASTPDAPRPPRTIERFSEIGHILVRSADDIVSELGSRLRKLALPGTMDLSRTQLEDHTATFLVDIGLALATLDEGRGEMALLRDGTEIQRTISYLHGAQRARLGWSQEALEEEFRLLAEITDATLRKTLKPHQEGMIGEAVEVVRNLLEQAERISIRGWRRALESEMEGGG